MFKLRHNKIVEQFITPGICGTVSLFMFFGKCKKLQFCFVNELRFP